MAEIHFFLFLNLNIISFKVKNDIEFLGKIDMWTLNGLSEIFVVYRFIIGRTKNSQGMKIIEFYSC